MGANGAWAHGHGFPLDEHSYVDKSVYVKLIQFACVLRLAIWNVDSDT